MTEYLKKMEWQPETIYYVKAISRNPNFPPKVWEHEGKYGSFSTVDVKVARYNTIDKQYTEIGDYQFIIAKSILEKVKEKVEKDLAFYLRKSSEFNKEGKPIAKYNIYNVPEEITDIQQDMLSEKEKKIPFDNYEGNDEIAFKEDIKQTEKTGKVALQNFKIKRLDKIIVTLQDIENDLRKLSNDFHEMLGKFSVRIKKER